jgi:hypothetical protein
VDNAFMPFGWKVNSSNYFLFILYTALSDDMLRPGLSSMEGLKASTWSTWRTPSKTQTALLHGGDQVSVEPCQSLPHGDCCAPSISTMHYCTETSSWKWFPCST